MLCVRFFDPQRPLINWDGGRVWSRHKGRGKELWWGAATEACGLSDASRASFESFSSWDEISRQGSFIAEGQGPYSHSVIFVSLSGLPEELPRGRPGGVRLPVVFVGRFPARHMPGTMLRFRRHWPE